MKELILKLIGNDIQESVEIVPSEIPFAPYVAEYCKMNTCGKYGTNWTCPPGVGSVDELKAKYTSYDKAFVLNAVYKLEDSFDFEGMAQGYKKNNALAYKVIKELRKISKDCNLLKAGSCDLCEKCTYPDSPCVHPEMAFPTVEACGIDVVTLAKNLGMNYYGGVNTVTYFMIFFYNNENA